LFGTDGKKLSKRDGATALGDYRDQGFLADAMFNYLAILGWSPDAETTVFTRDLAIEAFDLHDVNKNPAAFDPEKLSWMNGEYIRALDPIAFNQLVRPHVETAVGRSLSDDEWERFEEISGDVQERTKLLPEAGEQVVFLFNDVEEYDEKSWNKVMTKDGVADVLDGGLAVLTGLERWDTESIENALRALPDRLGIGVGKTFQPLRIAVTGSSVSPPLFESLAALGRIPTLARIEKAREELG
jgi:glutamyl-tRNA synthetase